MRRLTHTHGCTVCKIRVECRGPMVDNYDGTPERYCGSVDSDQEQTFLCEECYADQQAEAQVERRYEDFHGSSQPQTVEEQYQAAVEQKRKLG
jgi:hypothetical protein